MKLRTLQSLTFITSALALGAVSSASYVARQSPPDLGSRLIASWSPPAEPGQKLKKPTLLRFDIDMALNRPLFLPDRKPFQPPPPAPPPPQPEIVAPVVEAQPPPPQQAVAPPTPPVTPPPNATLKGVLLTDALDKAYITLPEAPDGAWYTVGNELSGWKLTRIEKDQVTLALGEQKVTLQLYVDNPANAVGNTPPSN